MLKYLDYTLQGWETVTKCVTMTLCKSATTTHLQLFYSVDERVVGSGHLGTGFIQGLQAGLSLPGQHHLQPLKKLTDLLPVLSHQALAAGLLLLQLLPQLTHLTARDSRKVSFWLGGGTCIYIHIFS